MNWYIKKGYNKMNWYINKGYITKGIDTLTKDI